MPYVSVRIAKGDDVTPEKKRELIKKVTDAVSETLNKKPSSTYVVIDEVDTDNWGVGGETLSVIRGK